MNGMIRFAGVLAVAAGIFAVSALPAEGGQLVRFKNGFEMQAVSVRFEGDTVFLTLQDGSEVGFPEWVLKDFHIDNTVPGLRRNTYSGNRIPGSVLIGANYQPLDQDVANEYTGWNEDEEEEEDRPPALAKGRTDTIGPGGVSIGFSTGNRNMPRWVSQGQLNEFGKAGVRMFSDPANTTAASGPAKAGEAGTGARPFRGKRRFQPVFAEGAK